MFYPVTHPIPVFTLAQWAALDPSITVDIVSTFRANWFSRSDQVMDRATLDLRISQLPTPPDSPPED